MVEGLPLGLRGYDEGSGLKAWGLKLGVWGLRFEVRDSGVGIFR